MTAASKRRTDLSLHALKVYDSGHARDQSGWTAMPSAAGRSMDRLKAAGLASLALTLLGGLAMILGKLLVDMHSH